MVIGDYMTKKKILLDIDEVVCFSGFLQVLNRFLNANYHIDQFTTYYLEEEVLTDDQKPKFMEYLSTQNLYEVPDFLPGAIETLERLNEYFDIYVCSSCVNPEDLNSSGRIFQDKYNFLIKYLPFLDPRKFIFTSTKNIFKADIQIDDRIQNLDSDIETKILSPSYHNKNITDEELKEKGILRAGTEWRNAWEEAEKILMSLLEK
jgi:5'(3')-deoxyribonucleotidase